MLLQNNCGNVVKKICGGLPLSISYVINQVKLESLKLQILLYDIHVKGKNKPKGA